MVSYARIRRRIDPCAPQKHRIAAGPPITANASARASSHTVSSPAVLAAKLPFPPGPPNFDHS